MALVQQNFTCHHSCCGKTFKWFSELTDHILSQHAGHHQQAQRPEENNTREQTVGQGLQISGTGAISSDNYSITSLSVGPNETVPKLSVGELISPSSKMVCVVDICSQENKIYKCSECEETSEYESSLLRHMKRKDKDFTIKQNIEKSNLGRSYEQQSNDNNNEISDTPLEVLENDKMLYKRSADNLTSAETVSLHNDIEVEHEGLTVNRKKGSKKCNLTRKLKRMVSSHVDTRTGFSVEKNGTVLKALGYHDKKENPNVNNDYKRSVGLNNHENMAFKKNDSSIDYVVDFCKNPHNVNVSECAEGSSEMSVHQVYADIDPVNSQNSIQVLTCSVTDSQSYKSAECDEISNILIDVDRNSSMEHKGLEMETEVNESDFIKPVKKADDDYQECYGLGCVTNGSDLCYQRDIVSLTGMILSVENASDTEEMDESSVALKQTLQNQNCKGIKIQGIELSSTFNANLKSKDIRNSDDIQDFSTCIPFEHRQKDTDIGGSGLKEMSASFSHKRYEEPREKNIFGNQQDISSDDRRNSRKRAYIINSVKGITYKRFKCSECDYTSNHIRILNRHMKLRHKGFRVITKTLMRLRSSASTGCNDVDTIDTDTDYVNNVKKFLKRQESMKKTIFNNQQDITTVDGENNRKSVYIINATKGQINGYKRYKCSECDYSHNHTGVLYRHMKYHHKGFKIIKKTDMMLKPNALAVGNCFEGEKIRKNVYILDAPVGMGYKYTCSECDYRDNGTSNLYKHMVRCHKGMRVIKRSEMRFKTKTSTFSENLDKTDVDVSRVNLSEGEEMDHKTYDKEIDNNTDLTGIQHEPREKNVFNNQQEITSVDGVSSGKCVYIVNTIKGESNSYNRYKCSECDYSYNHTGALYKHMKYHHKGFKIIKKTDMMLKPNALSVGNCFEGEKIRKNVYILDAPIGLGYKYTCSECDYRDNGTSNLYKHMVRCHKRMRVIKRSEMRFKTKTSTFSENLDKTDVDISRVNLSDGEEMDHKTVDKEIDNNTDFTCIQHEPREKNVFNNQQEINSVDGGSSGKCVYIVNATKGESNSYNRYKCSECDYSYNHTGALYKHMKYHHKGFKIIKKTDMMLKPNALAVGNCFEGEKIRKNVYILDAPIGLGYKYICSECDYRDNSTSNLYRHMVRCHKGMCVIKRSEMRLKTLASNFCENMDKNDEIFSHVNLSEGEEMDHRTIEEEISDSTDLTSIQHKLRGKNVIDNQQEITSVDGGSSGRSVYIINTTKGESDTYKRYKCSECDYTSNHSGILYRHMKNHHKGFRIITKNEVRLRTNASTNFNDFDKNETASDCFNNVKEISASVPLKHSEESRKKSIFNNQQDITSVNGGSSGKCVYIVNATEGESDSYKRHKCSKCDYTSNHTGNLYKHMKCHKGFKIIKKTDMILKPNESALSHGFEGEMNRNNDDSIDDSNNTDLTGKQHEPRGKNVFNNQQETASVDGGSSGKSVYIVNATKGESNSYKKYKCSECDYTSNHSGILYRHMKYYHKGFKIITKTEVRLKTNASIGCKDFENETDTDCVNNVKEISVSIPVKHGGESRGKNILNNQLDITSVDGGSSRKIVYIVNATKGESDGYKRQKCSECDYTSHLTGNLYKHMKYCHKGFEIITKTEMKLKTNASALVNDFEGERSGKSVYIVNATKGESDKYKRYKCSECDYTHYLTRLLYKHMKCHHKGFRIITKTDIRLKTYDDLNSDCDRKSVYVINAKSGESNSFKSYKCSECNYTSGHTGRLYRHMKRLHKGFRIITKTHMRLKNHASTPSVFVPECTERNDKRFDEKLDNNTVFHDVQKNTAPIVNNDVNNGQPYKSYECDERSIHRVDVARCLSSRRKSKNFQIQYEKFVESLENVNEPKLGGNIVDPIISEDNADISRLFVPGSEERDDDGDDRNNYSQHDKSLQQDKSLDDLEGLKKKGDPDIVGTNSSTNNSSSIDNGQINTVKEVDVHDKGNKRLYECSACSITSDSIGTIQQHMRTHSDLNRNGSDGEKKLVNRNDNCSDGTDDDDDDDDNVSKNGNIRYECSLCSFFSGSTTAVYKHMGRKHKGFIRKNSLRDWNADENSNDNDTDDNQGLDDDTDDNEGLDSDTDANEGLDKCNVNSKGLDDGSEGLDGNMKVEEAWVSVSESNTIEIQDRDERGSLQSKCVRSHTTGGTITTLSWPLK